MSDEQQIRNIRNKLQLSQSEFAKLIGVSFATVNRWENGHCKPSPIAMNEINRLIRSRNYHFYPLSEPQIEKNETSITLYHGSRHGIAGPIAPISRDRCDFGKGFYMGTEKSQPLTLICSYPNACLYTLKLNLHGLTVVNLDLDLKWALLIAYNRGKMDKIVDSKIYQYFSNLTKNVDLVIGYIANDRMFVVLDRFFNGEITDVALIRALSAIKLGKQYVALTQKACNQITIINKTSISQKERKELMLLAQTNRSEGISKAETICRQYRREGRYFDEILSNGDLL